MWRPDDVLDALAEGLTAREAALASEQAPYGLDALDEVDLHPILAEALIASGCGVIREQPYPHEWAGKPSSGKRLRATPTSSHGDDGAEDDGAPALPEHRDRMRCDLVLTPEPGQALADPLATVRQAETLRQQGAGSLFAAQAEAAAAEHAPAPDAVLPEDAFWLEVKTLGQFAYADGVPGPNTKYGSELVRAVRTDAAKLAADGMILHAAVLVVLFARTEEIARHDVMAAVHKCLDRDLAVSSPLFRVLPIAERIGNEVCCLALIPVRTL